MSRALTIAALLATGCQTDVTEPAPDTRHAPLAVPAASTAAPAVPRQEPVILVAAGAEPRTPLRYAPAVPQRLALETHAKGRQFSAGAWSRDTAAPPMTTVLEVTEAERGSLAIATLDGPRDGAWALLAGRHFTLATDDQARFGGLSFADAGPTGPAILDEAAQRLLALRVPVPSEPVGVGATWRVTTILRQRPALVTQTATYTLVARDAAHWSVGVELSRIAEPQVAEDPGVPAGTTVDVVALVLRVSGQLAIDPARALPTGDLSTTSTLHLKIATAGDVTEQLFEDESHVSAR